MYFGGFDLVEVVLHGILVYMVQKYLVDNNHYHLMIDNLVYSKVFCFYLGFVHYFYFVGKWIIFTLVLWNTWVIMRIYCSCCWLSKILFYVKINDFEYLGEKIKMFVVYSHNSKWLIAHMWLSWFNGGFNRRLFCYLL